MIDIPANFPQKNKDANKEMCICGQDGDMVYSCKKLNKYEELTTVEYLNIYFGNLSKQIRVFRRFQQNFERRESYLNETEKIQTQLKPMLSLVCVIIVLC